MPNQIRGSPGARVVGICLALDVVAMLVAGAVQRSFTSDSIAREMLVGAGYGIVVAQLAMLAIWLGVVATSLYWMLVVLALLCSSVLALIPHRLDWSALLTAGWACLSFTLPFGLSHVAGFRVIKDDTAPGDELSAGASQFALSRIFAWTFMAAALLAVDQVLPPTVAMPLATTLSIVGIAAIGLATLWGLLRPHALSAGSLLPAAFVLVLDTVIGKKAFAWTLHDTSFAVAAGIFYIIVLSALLYVCRRAGLRLVHRTAGGWLVR
jgi:hypothetical protein